MLGAAVEVGSSDSAVPCLGMLGGGNGGVQSTGVSQSVNYSLVIGGKGWPSLALGEGTRSFFVFVLFTRTPQPGIPKVAPL